MTRSFLVAMALSLLAPLSAARAADEPKPNVVIIFIDDLGYADIGPFGATKQKTPNLDRMAAEGMKLTSFYAAPVCSVSRAQMVTGCYGARVYVPGVYFPAGSQGLNPHEFTIAERLKERVTPPSASASGASATSPNSCQRSGASITTSASRTRTTCRGSRR